MLEVAGVLPCPPAPPQGLGSGGPVGCPRPLSSELTGTTAGWGGPGEPSGARAGEEQELLGRPRVLLRALQMEGCVRAEVASDTLVALSRNHFSLVMYELQHHLKPLNLTEESVIVTLAKLASGNGRARGHWAPAAARLASPLPLPWCPRPPLPCLPPPALVRLPSGVSAALGLLRCPPAPIPRLLSCGPSLAPRLSCSLSACGLSLARSLLPFSVPPRSVLHAGLAAGSGPRPGAPGDRPTRKRSVPWRGHAVSPHPAASARPLSSG